MAVQSLSDTQRENSPRCHIKSNEGVIVAGKANDVGYNTEERVRIDEECIGFSISQSDQHIYFSGGCHSRSLAFLTRLGSLKLKL